MKQGNKTKNNLKVSGCLSETSEKEKKHSNAQNQEEIVREELSISREQVMCNPTQFEGIKRYGLDPVVKWVKTDSLKISDVHTEIYEYNEEIDTALIESIRNQGVMTPLVVSNENVVISGSIRLKIAQLLGLEEVPVIYSLLDICAEDVVGINISRKKKYAIIYREYQILKRVLNIKQGSRSDLNKDKKKADDLPTILGVSRPTMARLTRINKISNEMFSDDPTEIKRIWEMVDNPKKGINSTLNYLKNLKYEKLNSNGEVRNLFGNGYTIYNSSSQEMSQLADNSVDLHMTSPPYWGGIRNYNLGDNELGWENSVDEFVENLANHFNDTKRVLKPTGSLVVNIGDSIDKSKNHHALAPMRFVVKMVEKGWHLAGSFIWLKSRFIPTPSKNRPISTFEYIFHFAKTPNYAFYKEWMSNDTDPIYNQLIFGKTNKSKCIKDVFDLREMGEGGVLRWIGSNTTALDKKCSSEGIEQTHSATFPLIIPSVFINLTTKPGDLVIDGFNGTASTGAACQILGRNYVGYELNKNYISVSKVRLDSIQVDLINQMAA